MSKKTIDMVAIEATKANAQNLTCFVTFVAAVFLSVILMLVACIMPAMVPTTEIVCWISMTFEALSIAIGYIAYWIRRNAL